MNRRTIARVDLNMTEINDILQKARAVLTDDEYGKLKAVAETLEYLTDQIDRKNTSIDRLRKLLFGPRTESSQVILKEADLASAVEPRAEENASAGEPTAAPGEQKKRPGHGRHGAHEYTGAQRVWVPHETLKAGGGCPDQGCHGTLHPKEPNRLVRLTAAPPIQGKVYELESLRCTDCGKVFTAGRPEGVGDKKFDERAGAMIGCLRYGAGFPSNRLEKLQRNAGVPVPATTQWEVAQENALVLAPVFEEIIDVAAQGDVLHNDDTPGKILEYIKERKAADRAGVSLKRKGVFTTGIVSRRGDITVALFFTGKKHAGENLQAVLDRRASELAIPTHMCDGLDSNDPAEAEVVSANCNAHSRRRFVEVATRFPEQCRHVLEVFRTVYHNDSIARKQKLSDGERLRFHQENSGPSMAELEKWLKQQMDEKLVEPNSGLGEAIGYMQKHWEKLTLFLHVPGVPLDNNVVERSLKKAILHRKASLFYKTQNGARVGDIYMSLIHTAELNGVDPFDYLTELLRHPGQVRDDPADWLPWNYKETSKAFHERPDSS